MRPRVFPAEDGADLRAVRIQRRPASMRPRVFPAEDMHHWVRTLAETSWLSPCVGGSFAARRGPGSDAPRSAGPEYAPCRNRRVPLGIDELDNFISITVLRAMDMGAALLRRRPNQSLRQRGRRQLDPSRRGEGAAEGTGGRWYLCRQRRLGVFRWYSRAWWRVSVRINAPAARGGLRTVATAAKCHRAPVDYHPVAGRMPTGLQ